MIVALLLALWPLCAQALPPLNAHPNATHTRRLSADPPCDSSTPKNSLYKRYFDGMDSIYSGSKALGTCLPVHKQCGWPATPSAATKLPLYVLSVGLEGAGHHLWTDIMTPVVDCVWKNARHYLREVGDGVPRTTPALLKSGLQEQLMLRRQGGKPPCRSIFDSEDSFPTGAIRASGRVFMHPDIVNLQAMDGVLFDVKYLIIVRNTTDTALSALRRNFFKTVDQELRTVEHTLTYVESALRGVPCHKIFIAHYEQALADPHAFLEPLSAFMQLGPGPKKNLKTQLASPGRMPHRKVHKLTQFAECRGDADVNSCYKKVSSLLDGFFAARAFMWPTFAANGFDLKAQNGI